MNNNEQDIFKAMLAGGLIRQNDPGMGEVWELVFRALKLSPALNSSTTVGENAVVAAGSLVRHDVEANSIVAGVPAKFVRKI